MEEFSVDIIDGVDVGVHDMKISVKGPKGTAEKSFDDPRFNEFLKLEKQGNKVIIKCDTEKRKVRAMAGTIRAHLNNMMHGVKDGYTYTLKIVYTHFPITVTVEKNEVHVKNFLGEKGSRTARIVGGSQVKTDKENISVTGSDLEAVSQTAANIERACKLTGRDKRIFQDGIYMDQRG